MSVPSCAVINFSSTQTDAMVQETIRVMNRQVMEDFMPVWGYGRTLKLVAATFDPADDDSLAEEKVPADSVIYLVDESSVEGALGYHDLNSRDIPVGFVFVLDPNDWTVTFSHEVLELILDPTVNIFVPGPHPNDPQNIVLHTYEVCDAVERTSYQIDGIDVSNFLTNSYFTIGEQIGTRNDFLGVGVTSFGVTENSHITFFNLESGEFETVFGHAAPSIGVAARRARAFAHTKPEKDEMMIQRKMDHYKATYKSKPAAQKFSGLPQLKGITRTGRYQAVAAELKARMKTEATAR